MWTDERIGKEIDGRIDAWTDGQIDRQMDKRQTDRDIGQETLSDQLVEGQADETT